MQSSDELWYQEIIDNIPDLIFDDYSSLASPSDDKPKGSCKGPKGGTGRPIRRRSRASSSSKNTPTTLLKADTKNFRAIVQQFTGCHSASPLLRAYKGPINLNFKQCTYYPAQKQQKQQQQQQQRQMHVGYGVHEEYHGFLPFGATIEDVTTGVDVAFDEDLIGVGQNPRADALTYDYSDVDSFWREDHHDHVSSGSGDYAAVLSGAMNHHEFWGY